MPKFRLGEKLKLLSGEIKPYVNQQLPGPGQQNR